MKKFLLSLLCLFAVGLSANAESFNWEYTSSSDAAITNANKTAGSVKTGDVTWTFTSQSEPNLGKDGNWKGIKIGGKSNGKNYNPGSITFSTDHFKGKKINNIAISVGCNANAMSDANSLVLKVDDTELVSEQIKNNTNTKDKKQSVNWSGESVCTETISFTITLDASNNVIGYFGPIAVDSEEISAGPVDPEYKIEPEDLSVRVGSSIDLPVITPLTLKYKFSTESDLIAIDEKNGKIIGLGIGAAVVKFETEAVDGKYNAGSGEFVVNVSGKRPRMSFQNQVVIAKLGTGVVWQIVDVTAPEGVLGNSDLVTYESSDPEIVSINEDNGQIKQLDIHKTGEVTITATFNPGDQFSDYETASAKYTIIVRDPSEEISDGYSIFDFTTSNPYGLTSWTSKDSSKYEKDADNPVTEIVGDEDVVTISFDNGSGNGYRAYEKDENKGYDFRVYNGCKMKFEVPDGFKITKIGFIGSTWCITPDPKSASTSEEDEESDELDEKFGFLWLPNGDEAVNTVTFTNNIKKDNKNQTCTIEKIEVLYESLTSTLKSANLSFKKNVNGIIMEEEAEINAVTNPFDRDIVYSIDGLDESQYTITPSEDKKTIKVLVKEPGYYTLMAKSLPGDGYRNGLAIMRLNVFAHLTVYADYEELTSEVINSKEEVFITMDVPDLAILYYNLEESSNVKNKNASIKEVEEDENLVPGFTKYEDGIIIPSGHEGNLHFYIANYGYKSPIRTMAVTKETAVEEIEAVDGEGEVRYFDLSGREVKGQPEKGLYIRMQGGKAEKVMK